MKVTTDLINADKMFPLIRRIAIVSPQFAGISAELHYEVLINTSNKFKNIVTDEIRVSGLFASATIIDSERLSPTVLLHDVLTENKRVMALNGSLKLRYHFEAKGLKQTMKKADIVVFGQAGREGLIKYDPRGEHSVDVPTRRESMLRFISELNLPLLLLDDPKGYYLKATDDLSLQLSNAVDGKYSPRAFICSGVPIANKLEEYLQIVTEKLSSGHCFEKAWIMSLKNVPPDKMRSFLSDMDSLKLPRASMDCMFFFSNFTEIGLTELMSFCPEPEDTVRVNLSSFRHGETSIALSLLITQNGFRIELENADEHEEQLLNLISDLPYFSVRPE